MKSNHLVARVKEKFWFHFLCYIQVSTFVYILLLLISLLLE